MTITVANTSNTSTFSYWLNRTNELADAMTTKAVTVNSNTAVGDASITGTFSANSVVVGNSSINVSISQPNTTQISDGGYYLNANGVWALIDTDIYDTNILFVDSSNNRVGVRTTSPSVELDVNGTIKSTGLNLGGTTITASGAEINILDGVTANSAELNILDGVTANTAEINILDGITASTAELNILDGVTANTAELNILDGVTANTAELNILDGATVTAAEINLLDGVTWTLTNYNTLTATAAELNVLDGITAVASQAEAQAGTAADKLMTAERTRDTVMYRLQRPWYVIGLVPDGPPGNPTLTVTLTEPTLTHIFWFSGVRNTSSSASQLRFRVSTDGGSTYSSYYNISSTTNWSDSGDTGGVWGYLKIWKQPVLGDADPPYYGGYEFQTNADQGELSFTAWFPGTIKFRELINRVEISFTTGEMLGGTIGITDIREVGV